MKSPQRSEDLERIARPLGNSKKKGRNKCDLKKKKKQ